MRLPDDEHTFVNAPPGTHLAICIRVIQLGSQPSTYNGQTKLKKKIRFIWELPQELMEDGRPMLAQQDYNFSMDRRATMRLMLESWRGAVFDAEARKNFALEKLLGKCCIVNVVHNEGSNGNTYANVNSVTRLMKDQLATAPKTSVNEQFVVVLYEGPEAFNAKDFAKLSDNVQAKIASSPEYRAIVGGHDPQTGELYEGPVSQPAMMDDQIPF